MSQDLHNIIKVKPCVRSNQSISLIKNKDESSNIDSEQIPNILFALRIANEIIETASLDVSKAAQNLALSSGDFKVGTQYESNYFKINLKNNEGDFNV